MDEASTTSIFSAGTDSATDKGEDHVDFSAGEADPATTGDSKGDGHVDFSVDATDSAAGGDMGNGHIDFSAGATDPASGDDRGQGHVVFRVAVHADGSIEVNGQQVGVCDPAEGCRITLSWVPGAGTVVVRVEDADGVACAGQYPMAEPPERIRIAAAEVRSLAVERQ